LGINVSFGQYEIRKLTGGISDDNHGSIKCPTDPCQIVEAWLDGPYVLDGMVMDRSCFEPRFFKTGYGVPGSIEAYEKSAYKL